MTHPSGVGLWAVALRGIGWPVFVPGHTAREAWTAAGPRLAWPDYEACAFMLLADTVTTPAPEAQPPNPAIAKQVRRKLRAAGAHP